MASTVYTYDTSGRLIREKYSETYNDFSSNSRDILYLYDESGIVGAVQTYNTTTETFYFDRNIKGDVIGIYNASGTQIAKYSYDSWGNQKVTTYSSNNFSGYNPIRYRGYYYDRETGLYYLNARYYNPQWRRFISPDSTEYIDPENPNGLNLYAYCNNDPINYADPSGHLAFFIVTAIIGAAAGVAITAAVDYIPDQEFNLHWGWYVFGGFVGAAIGAGIGMAISYTTTGTLSASTKWISAFNKAKTGDYSKLLKLSTKNPNSKYVSLGKYISKDSPANYINIAKKHGFTYFDMGKYYKMADKKGFAQIINKMFIEEQCSLGKIFYKTSSDISRSYKWELELLLELGATVLPF